MKTKTKLLMELDYVFPDAIFYSLPEDVRKYIRNAHDLTMRCIKEKIDDNRRFIANTSQMREQIVKSNRILRARAKRKEECA
jgi:hypothetical protein